MEKPKLALNKTNTAFGLTILEALEKGKSSTSTIDPAQAKKLHEASVASAHLDSLLKAALKKEDLQKEKLTKRRAKANQAKSKKPKPTEIESLRNQISLLSKSNAELKKQIQTISTSSPRTDLLSRALAEINKIKDRNLILEKENKTLRAILLENLAKTLDPSSEMVFYGGQYSDPET